MTKFCSGTYEEEGGLVVDDDDVEEAFMINLDFLYGDAATVDDEEDTVFKSLGACFCITARFLLLKPNSDDDDVNPVGILLMSREVLLLADANEQLTDRRNTETTTDNTTAPEALGLGLLIVGRRLVGIRYGAVGSATSFRPAGNFLGR